MRRLRNAKIVATLGPASRGPEVIRSLFQAGADVFRFNFSHGSHDDHRKTHAAVRQVEEEFGRPVAILQDLQGPKLRLGSFEGGGAHLEESSSLRLELAEVNGTARQVSLPHPEVFEALGAGDPVLLDDGRIRLRVEGCGEDFADTTVVVGGHISDRKGVNLPGSILSIAALTPKDIADLALGMELGVDWVAQSFVQRPEDVVELRERVAGRAAVMAKFEKPSAVVCLSEIMDLVDGCMVARGDLGVELPPEDVPPVQKQIIRASLRSGKPVIIATQMLESMVHAPTPTRAEASDVATAIYDGADAVMLSAESAVGRYPVEAVSIMDRIIERVEGDALYKRLVAAQHPDPEPTLGDSITRAARVVAEHVTAASIVTYTTSGSTTLRASRERPQVSILCLTPRRDTARRMVLAWGVHSVVTEDAVDVDDMVKKASYLALREELAQPGETIVITAGMPFGTPGATNLLRVTSVETGE